MKSNIQLKRVYDQPEPDDGFRILVDKVWPRGVKKEDAKLNCWMREVAPSRDLRHWFNHDPEKWEEFKERYRVELETEKKEILSELRKMVEEHEDEPVTLLYGARTHEHNNAVALKEFLTGG